MRRLVVVALVQSLVLAAPAVARERLAGAPSITHPTVLGQRVVYESVGTKPTGAPSYVLSSIAPGVQPDVLVSADTSVVRSGGVLHDTAISYAITPTYLALAELDTSVRGLAQLGSVTLSFGTRDGTATDTVVDCDQPTAAHAPPFAADSSRIAYVPGACDGSAESIAVFDAADGTTHGVSIPQGDTVHAIALAGNYVAYDLQPPSAGADPPRVAVANWTTGTEVFHLDGTNGPFALQADGTAVVAEGACPAATLLSASVIDVTPRLVPGARPCSPLRLAGGNVVYLDADRHLHVTQLNGGDEALVDAPVGDFDADDTYAAYTFPDCAGRALYRVALTEPPSAPSAPGACPVRLRSAVIRLRGTRVIAPLACPKACRGTATLSRAGARLARATFSVLDPGSGSAVLRLSAAVRRRLGHGRIAARLTLVSRLPSGNSTTSHAAITILRPGRR